MLSNSEIIAITKKLLKFVINEHLLKLKELSYQEYRLIIDKEEDFKEFSLNYPSLFNNIIDDPKNFDFDRLSFLLDMKEKIDNNTMSNEEATKVVGDHYYNEFVKDKIE